MFTSSSRLWWIFFHLKMGHATTFPSTGPDELKKMGTNLNISVSRTKLAKQTWQHIKKYNILWHSRTYKTLVYCGIIKMKVRWISYLKPIKQIKHIRIKWVVNMSAQNKYYILRYFWALVCSKVEAKQETTILINRDVTPYRLGLPYQ